MWALRRQGTTIGVDYQTALGITTRRGLAGLVALTGLMVACGGSARPSIPREAGPQSSVTTSPPDRLYFQQELTFTGAVQGRFSSAVVQPPCTLAASPGEQLATTLAGLIVGATADKRYVVTLFLDHFHGSGTYEVFRSGTGAKVEIADRDLPIDDFVGISGQVTVAQDQSSGVMDVEFAATHGDERSVHVSGTWRCGEGAG